VVRTPRAPRPGARLGRRVVIAFVVVGLVVTGAVALVNRAIDDRIAGIPRVALPEGALAPSAGVGHGPVNFLVVGSDSQPGVDGARSDTTFVARVTCHGMEAVWFPRDLLVTVPGHGLQRLNSAYSFGGPQTVVDTLRLNFDLSINHYVELDMRSFRDVVDAIGGVRLAFPTATRDELSGLSVPAGCRRVDGATALAVARSRHVEQYRDGAWQPASPAADISRLQTQQDLVFALAGAVRAKVAADPGSLPRLTDALLRRVRVDRTLTARDALAFARVLVSLDRGRLTLHTLPIQVATAPNSQQMLVPADGATALVKTLGGTLPESPGIAFVVPMTPIFTPC
jgi:LCP family protein required for cell wall assembly